MTTPRLVTPRLCLVPLDTRELALDALLAPAGAHRIPQRLVPLVFDAQR